MRAAVRTRSAVEPGRVRTLERCDLSTQPELSVAIVCVLPDEDRLEAADLVPLFALLGRFGGAVRATVLVGGERALAAAALFHLLRVPRAPGGLVASFAAGAEAALARARADVLVFLAPELADWRPEELALADEAALAIVARARGAAGWRTELDGGAQLREGLLAVAAELWRRRERSFAAAETWGELEARIRDAGAPPFDLRSLRRLAELGLPAPTAAGGAAAGLTRALARVAGAVRDTDARLKLDERRLPRRVPHGEPVAVELSGWVALLPQASALELRLAGRRYPIPVEVPRPDVLARYPDLADERCGFRFAAELAPLPPGVHEASLVVLPARAERSLGAVRVVERLEIACDRLLAPPAYAAGTGLPLLVEGRLIASRPPLRLEAWLDDRELDVEVGGESVGVADRPAEVAFRISGAFSVRDGANEHRLDLRVHDARGRSAAIVRTIEASAGEEAAPSIEAVLGARDPRSGSCALRVRGTSFSAALGERVALEVDGLRVGEAPLVLAAGGRLPIGTFDLRVEPRLEAGTRELAVVLLGEGAPRVVLRRTWIVEAAMPTLRVERAGFERDPGSGIATLRVDGEIAHANLVDALRVALDGRPLLDVDPRSFVAAGGPADEERRTVHLALPVAVEAGRHLLRLELRRAAETLVGWEREVQAPSAAPLALEVVSADLDRLRRESPAPVWSALAFSGELRGAPDGAELLLQLDGAPAERIAPGPDGRFAVATRIESGLHRAALEVVAGVETLARLPAFGIAARRFEIPAAWARDLDEVRAALGPAAAPIAGLGSAELLRCHLETRLDEMGGLGEALAALARNVRESAVHPGRLVDELPPAPSAPLRVLYFSWEVPWSGHGGGVSVVNLLRHLGRRHEIVLLHPVHAGAEGLSEEVRELVSEIVTMPRGWSRPSGSAPFGVDPALLPTFTGELAGAVAAELASGRYDVANFESAGGYFHVRRSEVPSLLVDLAVSSFAAASATAPNLATERDAAAWTAELLRALAFDTLLLPQRADRVAVVTEPEARFLLPFSPGRELHVNPIAIDLDAFAAAARADVEGAAPRFVFVGNFRHAPNRDAARRLVERIAPLLRARLPTARLVLAGPEMPAGLVDAARAAGVESPGFVADLASLYAAATATLAPIGTGGGMRVKLLEAMACGCPVVTTALGMNGIAARAGEEYLCAGSDEEFVEAAARLAEDGALRRALADRARALLEREHAIPVQGERRERIWAATIAAKRRLPG